MARKSQPFFGTTTDKSAAFPNIQSLKLEVHQDTAGFYTKHEWQRLTTYTLDSIQRYHRCANPRCQQGGLDLQQIVSFWPEGESTISCSGHEGSPQGRRKGADCMNLFKITLAVQKRARP
jgi:hypothetical protein